MKYLADKPRAEGRAEGIAETKYVIARRMLENDLVPDFVSSITGLSLAEIEKLRER